MAIILKMRGVVNKQLFAEMPDTPFTAFFGRGASIPRLYPYIEEHALYTVLHYWMNPRGDIMIRFLEHNDKYIKFVEGGMFISYHIKPN